MSVLHTCVYKSIKRHRRHINWRIWRIMDIQWREIWKCCIHVSSSAYIYAPPHTCVRARCALASFLHACMSSERTHSNERTRCVSSHVLPVHPVYHIYVIYVVYVIYVPLRHVCMRMSMGHVELCLKLCQSSIRHTPYTSVYGSARHICHIRLTYVSPVYAIRHIRQFTAVHVIYVTYGSHTGRVRHRERT